MDITMSRVHSASDTCDIYFTYIKVNHLLYTCSLDPFEDGILLDIPLVYMHRYYRSLELRQRREVQAQENIYTIQEGSLEAEKEAPRRRQQLPGDPVRTGPSDPVPTGLPGWRS